MAIVLARYLYGRPTSVGKSASRQRRPSGRVRAPSGAATWRATGSSEPWPGRICLERIDRALAELQAIRAEVAASMPAPNGLEADDLANDLIDTTSAQERRFL